MITLYSGTPGSGKSLHLAERLYYRLKNRRGLVVCNFDIALDKISKNLKSGFMVLDNMDITPKKCEQIAFDYARKKKSGNVKEGEILLVIDECQLMFNSRDWQRGDRNGWLKFFTQHRKYGYDIILVAQFDRMIDRQIRSLIEYEWIHRKVSNYGIWGKIVSMFVLGSLFVCVEIWYPMKERIRSEFFIGKKKFFAIYDTRMMFSGATQCDGGDKGAPAGALSNPAKESSAEPVDIEKLATAIKKMEEENEKTT